jgi:O-antigen/teichoic acid export membrane protein
VADPVGARVASGLAWMLAQTIGSKVVGFFGQIVLAWLLVPEEFGVVSLALVIMSFAGIVQQSGVREVLIRRHAQFGRWQNSAFWLSIASGLTALAVMVAAAPIAEVVFAAPGLAGLAIVLSLVSRRTQSPPFPRRSCRAICASAWCP